MYPTVDSGRSAGLSVQPLKQTSGNASLITLIRRQIEEHGPVPFAWFMQHALYHPEHGYYSSGRAEIGRGGDFFTNVSVGPLFGRLMTIQFRQMWENLSKPREFTIVEEGAHDGRFARDVLEALGRTAPELLAAVRYRIVEPFPIWRERQRQTLGKYSSPTIEWADQLEPFTGVHFSNELLDSIPVNLRGKAVGLDGDQLLLVDQTDEHGNQPNELQFRWVDRVAASIERGYILAVDYGFPEHEFREMVQVRSRHRKLDSPFEQIGHADITAHVNWTDVARRAETHALRLLGFVDQHHFLAGILSDSTDLVSDPAASRALQTLLHPEMLGRAFQVLLLGKNVSLESPLSGLKYAPDVRVGLAL